MHLDQGLGARVQVESVDVLSHEQERQLVGAAPALDFDQGPMGWVRLRPPHLLEPVAVPGPAPFRLLLEVAVGSQLSHLPLPDCSRIRAPEGRNPRGQGDPGAGHDQERALILEVLGQVLKRLRHPTARRRVTAPNPFPVPG